MKALLSKERQKQKLLKQFGYDIKGSREFILSKANLTKGHLLEIGTGRGHFTVSLAQKGFKVTSIDLDPQPQKMAKVFLKAKGLSNQVRILVLNAENLKFPAGSFENVVSVNFMHHAEDPIKCLKEIVRVARSKIVIADVNKKGAAILERFHKTEGHKHPRSRISFNQMRDFLIKKGFQVKAYKGFCQTVIVAQHPTPKGIGVGVR